MKKKLPILVKSIFLSLNIFPLYAMETTSDDVIFPDPQLYPTVAQVEKAYEGRYHYNYCYPSINVGTLNFHQGWLQVCFNLPIKFKEIEINDFNGDLSIIFEGTSGGIKYKCSFTEEVYNPHSRNNLLRNIMYSNQRPCEKPTLDEYKTYLESRATITRDKILKVMDILLLANKQSAYFGRKLSSETKYLKTELESFDDNAFVNIKLEPFDVNNFNTIKRAANTFIRNKTTFDTSFYPDLNQVSQDLSLGLIYKINLDGIDEIKIKMTHEPITYPFKEPSNEPKEFYAGFNRNLWG